MKYDLCCAILSHAVCSNVGLLAMYWNRVFFPESCRDQSLNNATIYGTLIRSAGSWVSFGQVIEMIMKWFNWLHLVVLTDQNAASFCPYGAASIVNWLSTVNSTTDYVFYRMYMSDNPLSRDIDFYLDTISQRSRGELIQL